METLISELRAARDELAGVLEDPDGASISLQGAAERALGRMDHMLGVGSAWSVDPVRSVPPCPCACNSGGFCGGCGHRGCGGRRG